MQGLEEFCARVNAEAEKPGARVRVKLLTGRTFTTAKDSGHRRIEVIAGDPEALEAELEARLASIHTRAFVGAFHAGKTRAFDSAGPFEPPADEGDQAQAASVTTTDVAALLRVHVSAFEGLQKFTIQTMRETREWMGEAMDARLDEALAKVETQALQERMDLGLAARDSKAMREVAIPALTMIAQGLAARYGLLAPPETVTGAQLEESSGNASALPLHDDEDEGEGDDGAIERDDLATLDRLFGLLESLADLRGLAEPYAARLVPLVVRFVRTHPHTLTPARRTELAALAPYFLGGPRP